MLTVNDAEVLCDLLATRGTYFLGRVWVTVPPRVEFLLGLPSNLFCGI